MKYAFTKQALYSMGACTLALVTCSGCSMWSGSTAKKKDKDSNWSVSKLWKKEYQVPQSMAAIWAADVLTIPGKPSTRGFGGRIYFYNELSQAIPVDGELLVHGYLKNTQKGQSDQVAADKTFGFTAEQLTGHFSPSEMGASYSIWIPWDAADGLRQEITLIPTLKTKDGGIVQGSPAKVNLPGRTADGGEEGSGPMQTVSYTKSSIPTNDVAYPHIQREAELTQGRDKKMRTTTINVPPNSTIAQPRPTQAFILGTPQPSAADTGMGVSTGGALQPNSGLTPAPTTTPGKPTPDLPAESGQGPRHLNYKLFANPPVAGASAFPKAEPLPPATNEPSWTGPQRSVIRPAAFRR